VCFWAPAMSHSGPARAADAHFPSAFSEPASTRLSYNSLGSADVVVPIVLEFVQPASVVDFGCKHGEWLSVFRQHGSSRLLGFDQPKRIRHGLVIDESEFRVADLRERVTLDDRFDLAVCIEVAEHLPASAASPLIEALTSAAPVVLFSAAMPDQGGLGHFNEQPRQYWNDRFAGHGFEPVDCLRPRIWQDRRVAWWYRQNLFFFYDPSSPAISRALRAAAAEPRSRDLELVHADRLDRAPLTLLREFARSVARRLATVGTSVPS
jgi:Methyltransferase domain